jgi:hypothetical protein
MPEGLLYQLQPEQVRAVLLHELAHIRRGDLWINLIQTVLQIAYFYNPLVWLANWLIRRIREQAVDETVLVAMGDKARDYPETLVGVARLALGRPGLGLRLIGVVESKAALSGRIRHMLSRPFPMTARLGLCGGVTVVLSAVVFLPMARAARPEYAWQGGRGEKGPLDIKLVGVQPDAGDRIYDANGTLIREDGFAVNVGTWDADEQYRVFRFEVPRTGSEVMILGIIGVTVAGQALPLSTTSWSGIPYFEGDRQMVDMGVCLHRATGRFSTRLDVNKVDVNLRYYYGPPRTEKYLIQGPFEPGKPVASQQTQACTVTAKADQPWPSGGATAQFELSCPTSIDSSRVLAYDQDGRRYVAQPGGSRGNSRSHVGSFRVDGLSVRSMARITIGEEPWSCEFRNVTIGYPQEPARDRAPCLAAMAERLNLKDLSPNQLSNYVLRDVNEVVGAIDVVRGQYLVRKAADAIRYGRARPGQPSVIAGLDEASRQKVLGAARRWEHAPWPGIKATGIAVGLAGGGPEFVDLALGELEQPLQTTEICDGGLLQREALQARREVVASLCGAVSFTPDQLDRVKRLILNPPCIYTDGYLMEVFQHLKIQDSRPVLREMIKDDRPWIWWPAMRVIYDRDIEALRPFEGQSAEMKKRIICMMAADEHGRVRYTVDTRGESFKEAQHQAFADLPAWFDVELARTGSPAWSDMFRVITRSLDRKTSTAALVQFVRGVSVNSEEVLRSQYPMYFRESAWRTTTLATTLNAWYGVDLGKLGPDVDRTADRVPNAEADLQALASQILAWYDSPSRPEPVEDVFRGRVVDVDGRSVAGAVLTFTSMEDYTDEAGQRRQRPVDLGSYTTDPNGEFGIHALRIGPYATFVRISAPGCAPRRGMMRRVYGGGAPFFCGEIRERHTVTLVRPEAMTAVLEQLSRDLSQSTSAADTPPARQRHIEALAPFTQMDSGQTEIFGRILERVDDPGVFRQLSAWLQQTEPETRRQAAPRLAHSRQPWIWWLAVSMLDSLPSTAQADEEVNLRRALTRGPGWDTTGKAYALVPEVMTPEFARMSPDGFTLLRLNVVNFLGRQKATQIDAGFLRQLSVRDDLDPDKDELSLPGQLGRYALTIVQDWNAWYGVNIANVGFTLSAGERTATAGWRPASVSDVKALIARALQWAQDNAGRQPVSPSITGRVVDASGNGVAGVPVTLVASASRAGGVMTEAGQALTRQGGRFEFRDVNEGWPYLLRIGGLRSSPGVSVFWDRSGHYDYNPADDPIVLPASYRVGAAASAVRPAAPWPEPLASQRTDRYVPPDPNGFFADDLEGGKRLDALFQAVDKDSRPDEEILTTVRQGLRRTAQHKTLILAWIGNRYIWNKDPQNAQAIEIMYHAVPLERHYAVYFGLSVVKDKSPNILRTLAEICLQGEEVGRITWGVGDQKEQLLSCIRPHLQDADPATREIAEVLVKHFAGQVDFEQWNRQRELDRNKVEYGGQMPELRQRLLTGDGKARREALGLIQRERIAPLMDDSFLDAMEACAKDGDSGIRNDTARLTGQRWIWGAQEQSPRAIALMRQLAADEKRDVRNNAVYFGLSTIRQKDKSALSQLVRMALKDHEPDLHGRIVWSLTGLQQETRSLLIQVLSDELGRTPAEDLRARASLCFLYKATLADLPPADWGLQAAAERYPDDLFGIVVSAKEGTPTVGTEDLWPEVKKALPSGVTAKPISSPNPGGPTVCLVAVRGKETADRVAKALAASPSLATGEVNPLSPETQLYFEETGRTRN